MINIQFNSEVNGVTECNCHHVTVDGNEMLIHFTKKIVWKVLNGLIKQIG